MSAAAPFPLAVAGVRRAPIGPPMTQAIQQTGTSLCADCSAIARLIDMSCPLMLLGRASEPRSRRFRQIDLGFGSFKMHFRLQTPKRVWSGQTRGRSIALFGASRWVFDGRASRLESEGCASQRAPSHIADGLAREDGNQLEAESARPVAYLLLGTSPRQRAQAARGHKQVNMS